MASKTDTPDRQSPSTSTNNGQQNEQNSAQHQTQHVGSDNGGSDKVSYKTVSKAYSGSSRSNRSSASHALMKHRARIEAAKVRHQFAVREAELSKQEEEIRRNRMLLKSECDVKEAEAELKIVEELVEEEELGSRGLDFDVEEPETSKARVEKYLSRETNNNSQAMTPNRDFMGDDYVDKPLMDRPSVEKTPLDREPPVRTPLNRPLVESSHNGEDRDRWTDRDEPRNSPSYEPGNVVSELTKFMLKKDLVKYRLSKFNDIPSAYLTWKTSFRQVMSELDTTPTEEMDLLLQNLGPNSTRFATTIRTSTLYDPRRGLERIWERLEEEYGRPEVIQTSLNTRLTNFPKLTTKDTKKLFELWDLLAEVEAIKEDPRYSSLLSYFDTSAGINPVLNKLPYGTQEKWVTEAERYKDKHGVMFPPFSSFVKFIHRVARVKNDPCLNLQPADANTGTTHSNTKTQGNKFTRSIPSGQPIACHKTDVSSSNPTPSESSGLPRPKICPIHNTPHSLNDCKVFRSKPLDERKQFLKDKGLCFKCCGTARHRAQDCKVVTVTCGICRSNSHPTGLHVELSTNSPAYVPAKQGGESAGSDTTNGVSSKCTQLCGADFNGRSCAKIVLVRIHPEGKPELERQVYAVIDDQSNRSLAKSEFFDCFEENGKELQYTLLSCAGLTTVSGRRATNYVISSMDSNVSTKIPTLIECDQIPDSRNEIPTREVALEYDHLRDIAQQIPPVNPSAKILLLLGRDVITVHQVLEHRIGPGNAPYAQRLGLGWVIIGEVCLGKVHKPQHVNVKKTFIMNSGKPTIFPLCGNNFTVKECNFEELCCVPDSKIFVKTAADNKLGKSAEDQEFEKIMEEGMTKDQNGHWEAPLPFRSGRTTLLPNNKDQALSRARMLERSLKKDENKREMFCDFMGNLFDKGYIEEAPPSNGECWYLPIFGVYNPKKPGQVRVVFDSSASHQGMSLNKVLLPGPNLVNDLTGVLTRFRLGQIAVTADIQQMFYAFKVAKESRDYLRFLWYKDNNFNSELTEYRMKVHVFGNTTSPAVATYALRKTVDESESDVKDFVNRQFYVDDGLLSMDSVEEAVDLLKRTQHDLSTKGGLKLHKIASNSVEPMSKFNSEALAKELQSVNFTEEYLPSHQSLGLSWNLNSDCFTFLCPDENRPLTKRGALATINSVFDPIGFLAPVLIHGRMILREITSDCPEWDEQLPEKHLNAWTNWVHSLKALETLNIPRPYASIPLTQTKERQLHIFCDASEKAISAVAYLRVFDDKGNAHVGFVFGKAKLAPSHGHSLPRLELCAAVVGVEIGEAVQEALKIPSSDTYYYTDSQVVLGYINNRTRRFYTYVSNRVDRIRSVTKAGDWSHVRSEENPADLGTRSVPAEALQSSMWLSGPACLVKPETCAPQEPTHFSMIDPDEDKEVRPLVSVCKSQVQEGLGVERFTKFSRWRSLVRAIVLLKSFLRKRQPKGLVGPDVMKKDAHALILREVQNKNYAVEVSYLKQKKTLPKQNPLSHLNPFLDDNGIMRVGGRLQHASLNFAETHPVMLPGKSHVASLIVRDCHERSFHQGRLITEGAVRSDGYWITGLKRLINTLIHKCIQCRKLRGKEQQQLMAALPQDRVTIEAPFTNIGVDVFGPWDILTRKTRGGQSNSKRWAVMFTCLATRATHIEVVEEMSSSSFINALRRLIALRGKVKLIRSDQGTNFVGAAKVIDKDIKWLFNAPHSSHMGGVWERVIGVARRILDSMLSNSGNKTLTHEVLVTLMAEVAAIMNSRPMALSSDPENPMILSPALLLTHKNDSDTCATAENDIDIKDMYRAQWKRVQYLSQMF